MWIKGPGLESSRKGVLAVCRVLSSYFMQDPGARKKHSRHSSKLPRPPAVFQDVLTLGYWSHFSAKRFSQVFFSFSGTLGLIYLHFMDKEAKGHSLSNLGQLVAVRGLEPEHLE